MAVKMEDVKKLREITGAGLTDCKNALVEANENVEEAVKILQKKGLAASDARSGRATSEGRVFIKSIADQKTVRALTVKCETDFVANNAEFAALGDAENITEAIDKLKISMRENIKLGLNLSVVYGENDVIGTYVHSDNKSGAVVVISDVADKDRAKIFAKDCCLHLVAFTPLYTSTEDVPAEYISEKTEIFKAQMDKDPKMAAKPDNVKEGILKGKIKKHLAEICFMEQAFVKDDKASVKYKLKQECGLNAVIKVAQLITL